jgi:hypothetical protein
MGRKTKLITSAYATLDGLKKWVYIAKSPKVKRSDGGMYLGKMRLCSKGYARSKSGLWTRKIYDGDVARMTDREVWDAIMYELDED